jgi:hypothetical protein
VKAIRPLLLVDYEPAGNTGPEGLNMELSPERQVLVIALPDGTQLIQYDATTGRIDANAAGFERLTACEAVEP